MPVKPGGRPEQRPEQWQPPQSPAKPEDKASLLWQGRSTDPAPEYSRQSETGSDRDSGIRTSERLSHRSVSSISDESVQVNDQLHSENPVDSPAIDTSSMEQTRELGKGRCARVFLVQHREPEKDRNKYAFKVPLPKFSLENEEKIAGQLDDHPNIAKCYGSVSIQGTKGLLMEYIPGVSSGSLMTRIAQAMESYLQPDENGRYKTPLPDLSDTPSEALKHPFFTESAVDAVKARETIAGLGL